MNFEGLSVLLVESGDCFIVTEPACLKVMMARVFREGASGLAEREASFWGLVELWEEDLAEELRRRDGGG